MRRTMMPLRYVSSLGSALCAHTETYRRLGVQADINPWRYIGARIVLFGRGVISQELRRGLVIYSSGPHPGVVCKDRRRLNRAFERPQVWSCCRVRPLMRIAAHRRL
jgi:hypothetical protein